MQPDGGFKGILRRHHPDRLMLLLTCILILFGLIVIYSIGGQRANVLNSLFGSDYSDNYFFINQLISVGLSLIAFFVAYKVPFSFIKKNAVYVLLLGFLACGILAVAGWLHLPLAQCTYGACRWLNIGIKGFQPSELLKLGLLLYLAVFLGARANSGKVDSVKTTLTPLAVVAAIALGFVVVIQKDLGTGVVMVAIILSMLFTAGISKRLLFFIIAGSVVLGLVFTIAVPHRLDRLTTFLGGDTSSNTEDSSTYHVDHAKMAIGSGGLLGVGIGNSVQATGYLPESINDSIFAIMGETFGFVGLVAVLALFVVLLLRVLNTVYFLHDHTGRILASGVFGWVAAHVIMNIAAMTGLMPLTGITLPLLSYGGTSMLFIAFSLGVVYQLSSYTAHTPMNEEGEDHEDTGSRRRIGRTHYTSHSSRR
ncbi:FtsW/RodA/SpoVE family cell cycle protein [Candidatus Saccharibacteria bacterium]|nr:FtsW/RodA/SpoVE family cell cycle protein [Candidatus Saccharibacteria bacterium]